MKMEDNYKKLICAMHEAEIKRLPAKEELQEKYTLSDTFYHRMKRLIAKQNRKKKWKNCANYVAAAAIVIIVLLSISHPQYLVNAKNAFMKWFDNHAEFHFKENTGLTEIPRYEMEYVPEGYVLQEDNYIKEGMGLVVYTSETEMLTFDYELSDSNTNMNNEDVTFSIIKGNKGDTIYYFECEDMSRESSMMWLSEDENVLFTIIGVFDTEEMLKMQESVHVCK